MATVNVILIKAVRLTGWPLLVLIPLYLLTGYVLGGQWNVGEWMNMERALYLHRNLDVLLIVLFLAHSVPAVWVAVGRWTRRRKEKPA